MPELGPSGSVRGAPSNGRPYRDTLRRPRKSQCGSRPARITGKVAVVGEASEIRS
jgi:hypothetical protein